MTLGPILARPSRVVAVVMVALALTHARAQDARPGAGPAAVASGGTTIGSLHTVTLSTGEPEVALRFYRDALGLRVRGPLTVQDDVARVQRRLWGLPDAARWSLYVLDRPSAPGAAQIRLLAFEHAGPLIRTGHDARQPAPFAMGFPGVDVPAWDAALRASGYASLAPMEDYSLPRPDGSRYGIHESIFEGPDGVRAVLISRRDGMPQLGPVDPSTGRGGPAYSTQIVTGSDAVLAFYAQALGLELRSDREWKAGAGTALGIPPGTPFRFAIVYAPGASSGHLLFLDFKDASLPPTGVAPRPPNRGLGMWTFPVTDLSAAERRLRAAGAPVIGGPVEYVSPELGHHRALTVTAPNGFLVELVELLDKGAAPPPREARDARVSHVHGGLR